MTPGNHTDCHLRRISRKVLEEPFVKYGVGYRLDLDIADHSIDDAVRKTIFTTPDGEVYQSLATSIVPEIKREPEVRRIQEAISLITEYQNSACWLLKRLLPLRQFVAKYSSKSEIGLDNQDWLCEIPLQRLDYIIDSQDAIRIVDINVIPLGLGIFSVRDQVIKSIIPDLIQLGILRERDTEFATLQGFDLKVVKRALTSWLRHGVAEIGLNLAVTGNEELHLLTEGNHPGNREHYYVSARLSELKLNTNLTYVGNLRYHNQVLSGIDRHEILFVWRYGRFMPERMAEIGWRSLYQAYADKRVIVINKPGIYKYENKILFALPFITGFQEIVAGLMTEYEIDALKRILPTMHIVKVDRAKENVFTADQITETGELVWTRFSLDNLPRNFVLKTPDTSGSRGVRVIVNKSLRKCQQYFWRFVNSHKEYSVILLCEFVRPKKRAIIDPRMKDKMARREAIFKDQVFFATWPDHKSSIVGFSAMARTDSYDIYASSNTISVVQFYERLEDE